VITESALVAIGGLIGVIALLFLMITRFRWHVFLALLVPIVLFALIPGIDRDLGRAYTQTRQFQKAHQAFQRAIHIEDDNPVTHLYLGELLEQESDYRGAVRSYLRARQLAPLWPEAARRLGYAYRKLNRAAEAHYYLGQAYLLQDEEQKAIESLERAVREYKEGSPRIQVIRDEIEVIRAQIADG